MVLAMGCATSDAPMGDPGGSGGNRGTGGTGGGAPDGGVSPGACEEAIAMGGELGGPCRMEAECNGVLECLPVQTDTFGGANDPIHDHPDGPDATVLTAEFVGNYCTSFFTPSEQGCTEQQATACDGECGICDPYYSNATICLRKCVAEVDTNSTCFDAYQCDILFEGCYPGCQTDDDCRVFREDTNGNGEFDPWDPETLTGDRLVYDVDSTFFCNTDTYRCEHPGTPEAKTGDPCDNDQQCEANGICIDEEPFGYPGGYCTTVRCDIDPCAGDGICAQLFPEVLLCAERCEVGSGGMPYLGNTQGCRPGYTCFWAGVADDPTGLCVPGEFNDVVDPNIGFDCAEDSECYSPFGQGACFATDLLGCTVLDCGAPGMPGDVCGDDAVCVDPEEGLLSLCVAKCSAAEDCLPGAACVDLDPDDLMLDDIVCLPFCEIDAECRAGETCVSGSCTP